MKGRQGCQGGVIGSSRSSGGHFGAGFVAVAGRTAVVVVLRQIKSVVFTLIAFRPRHALFARAFAVGGIAIGAVARPALVAPTILANVGESEAEFPRLTFVAAPALDARIAGALTR